MWLAYAAGNTEHHGHEIHLVDAPAAGAGTQDVITSIPWTPDLVVVDTSTPSIANDLVVAGTLAKAWPRAHISLVGTHVTALPEEALSFSHIHSVARGEYDETIAELADSLDAESGLESIPGLSWKNGRDYVANPPRPLLEDLDQLPFVSRIYRRFLDFRNYFNPNALSPMVTIVSSRGCPYGCDFCVYPHVMTGTRQRLRNVARVVDEMEEIVESFPGVRAVFFEDDTLTANRAHARRLSEEILERDLSLSWTTNARADVDYDTLKLMKKAHLRCLCVGFESGSEALLAHMHKRLHVDRAVEFMADAQKAGVLVHGCFLVGMAGETEESMQQTLKLALRLNPDTAQFYPLMVYPGSPAYDESKKLGFLAAQRFDQWLTPEGYHTAVTRSSQLEPQDLVSFCSHARRRFYLRPRFLARKLVQAFVDEGERIRIMRASRIFWRHLVSP